MRKILLDTNFLLIPRQFGVDIFSEIERICHFNYQLCFLDRTMDELKNIIEKQRGKHKEAAKVAIKLLELKNVEEIKTASQKHTDEVILGYAKKGYLVATQDKDLKRNIINHGASAIILRQKKTLVIINDTVNYKGFN